MADRVRIPAEHTEMFKDLCTNRKNQQVFDTYKDLLMFSASLGYKENKRIAFDKSDLDPVRLSIFSGIYDQTMFNFIAIATNNEPKILSSENEDERIKMFEEYANGGLSIIKDLVYNKPGNWEGHLLNMIVSQNDEQRKDPLDDITSAWE